MALDKTYSFGCGCAAPCVLGFRPGQKARPFYDGVHDVFPFDGHQMDAVNPFDLPQPLDLFDTDVQTFFFGLFLAGAFATIVPDSLAAFSIAYFFLPCAAAIALKYNTESTNRMAIDIKRLEESLGSAIKGLR